MKNKKEIEWRDGPTEREKDLACDETFTQALLIHYML